MLSLFSWYLFRLLQDISAYSRRQLIHALPKNVLSHLNLRKDIVVPSAKTLSEVTMSIVKR